MKPLLLNVPFNEKDEAKTIGAFWDPALKTWYLPGNKFHQLEAVKKWLPEKDANILISNLTVAHNSRECWKCGQENTVIALGAASFYEKDEETNIWEEASFFTLFQGISKISPHLVPFLQQQYPLFKPGYSRTTNATNWNNHCPSCKSLQGEFFLFDEPGGAFFPTDPAEAQEITMIEYPLQYAVLLKAVYSMGGHLELMEDHAQWE